MTQRVGPTRLDPSGSRMAACVPGNDTLTTDMRLRARLTHTHRFG